MTHNPNIADSATATNTNTGDQTITLTGDVTGSGVGSFATTLATVTVAKGGTGATSLTAHGVVIGNGTSAVNVTSAGTSGTVLTSNGASADPTFQAVSAGTPVTGGPIFPSTEPYPITNASAFPTIYTGGGSGSKTTVAMGVAASIGADTTWRLKFVLPGTLPSGTCKLVLWAMANATSGNAKVNPKWGSCAVEEDPSSTTLSAEGTSTQTWGAGDTDQIKQLKITLDADTPVAGEMIVMDLVFETSSWTLAALSAWLAFVIFE